MIKLNKIEPETVNIYHDEHGFIGAANEYEFNDLRVQIKESDKEKGYYILKDDKRYYIDTDGRLPEWNFFNLIPNQLSKLI